MSAVLRLGHPTSAADVRVLADLTAAQKALVPVSNYVQVGGIWVPESPTSGYDLDNDYDVLNVDLTAAHVAPGTELLVGGSSVAGRNWSVVDMTGACQLKMNANTEDPIDLTNGFSLSGFLFTKLFIVNTAQLNKVLKLYVGRRI